MIATLVEITKRSQTINSVIGMLAGTAAGTVLAALFLLIIM